MPKLTQLNGYIAGVSAKIVTEKNIFTHHCITFLKSNFILDKRYVTGF